MTLLALLILLLPQTKADPQVLPDGHWRIVGNGIPGYLAMHRDFDGSIKGSIYDDRIEGAFDPATQKLTLRRLVSFDGVKPQPVQVFTGVIRPSDKGDAKRVISGTFRSLAGPNWGKDGEEYAWEASELAGTMQADELKQMAGRWEVLDDQIPGGLTRFLPRSSPLVQKKAVLEIRDNQIFHEGKMVATIANDLHLPETMPPLRPNRKPMMVTFKDGSAYLVAFDFRSKKSLEVVFPHTTGNVGRSEFLYWKKLEETEKSKEPSKR